MDAFFNFCLLVLLKKFVVFLNKTGLSFPKLRQIGVPTKIRPITRPGFTIRQKLAASGIILVWTYEKVGRLRLLNASFCLTLGLLFLTIYLPPIHTPVIDWQAGEFLTNSDRRSSYLLKIDLFQLIKKHPQEKKGEARNVCSTKEVYGEAIVFCFVASKNYNWHLIDIWKLLF